MLPKVATKPRRANHGREVQLVTNYHSLKIQNSGQIFQYSTSFEPECADTGKICGLVIKGCREELDKAFKFHINFSKNLYSYEMINDPVVAKTTVDDQEYTLTVKFSRIIEKTDSTYFSFFAIFFKTLMRQLNFEQIGRNCFNPRKSVTVQSLEIWPGFYSAMQNLEGGLLMQIDLTSKVCRKDNVLKHMQDMMGRGKDNEAINEEFKGMSVTTSYSKAGKHVYKVESVDFTKSVNDEFEKKDGKISFKNYFE